MNTHRTRGTTRQWTSPGPSSPHNASVTSGFEELLDNNRLAAERFSESGLAVSPSRKLAVVTCMDSRMDVFRILGLGNGEAHILRNAGGVVTDDMIRSLCLSQRELGTTQILLMHHTDCGLQKVSERDFMARIEHEVGIKPWWALEAFSDPFDDVRQSIQRLYMTPFLIHKERIRGFVYDVDTSRLHEVQLSHN
ncbi:MAG TPA: carbonic anhydrase [Acidimicrobiales bacterium]|nr:carbonic anhydrase [Acidimicrobiales bacterium]